MATGGSAVDYVEPSQREREFVRMAAMIRVHAEHSRLVTKLCAFSSSHTTRDDKGSGLVFIRTRCVLSELAGCSCV